MNRRTVYGAREQTQNRFNEITKNSGLPSACIECGQCESVCPQHIDIINNLKKRGFDLPDGIYTVDQAVDAISRLRRCSQ